MSPLTLYLTCVVITNANGKVYIYQSSGSLMPYSLDDAKLCYLNIRS